MSQNIKDAVPPPTGNARYFHFAFTFNRLGMPFWETPKFPVGFFDIFGHLTSFLIDFFV